MANEMKSRPLPGGRVSEFRTGRPTLQALWTRREFLIVGSGLFLFSYCSPSVRTEKRLEGSGMEKITSTDGTVISFYRSGSGPPLLLVHGTTANHQRWASVSPRLQQQFTVYAMDRRGRGESGDSPDYHIMREAEDVAAIADAIGEPVSILGHSYGAVCSLEASLLTNNIQKLILYEPPIPTGLALYPPDTPVRMQDLIDKGESEAALEVFFREIVRMPDHELESYRQLPMWKGRISLAPTIPRELVIDRSYQFDPVKFR